MEIEQQPIESLTRKKGKRTRYYIDNELLKMASIIKPKGIALYNAIAVHANSKTQSCFPSYETLIQKSGIGNRNELSRYLKILEKYRLIIVERFNGRKSNRYWLIDPCLWKKSNNNDRTSKTNKNSITGVKEQYQSRPQNSITGDTLNQIKKSDKEIMSPHKKEGAKIEGPEKIKETLEKRWGKRIKN